MIGGLRRWLRLRRRWPLTRQIAIVFTALMIGNAVLISTALDYWSDYAIARELESMSPMAQRAYDAFNKGRIISGKDLKTLNDEFKPIEASLNNEIDTALYGMIGVAGLITMGLGYLFLGRLGRGLSSVAMAARRIADGDLSARATHVGFASREETQLMGDFNTMSSALQRAERELAESTASIAHELRTPLTILRGRLHGIADGVFALESKEVEGLLYQVEGLSRLVDDLQTLSLAKAQRMILDRADTDLAEEVRRVLAATQPDLEASGLEPVIDLAPTKLHADGARLRQILGAVLANARRYAPDSGILRITTREDGPFAVLEVIDNGPGLQSGGEDLAFDRFWRGEVSRNRHTGGSGLGLAVVRVIVETHGGTATLRNHTGGGAIFTMRLPCDEPLHMISTLN